MKVVRFILGQWRLLSAALVAAAIIHIWTTLSAMDQAITPGYTTLVKDLPVNQITYLPPITPDAQPLPFLMPDALYAVCRYDASKGALRVTSTLPEAGWSLSLHAPNGDNFYFVAGTDARETKLDLVLQPIGAAYLSATAPHGSSGAAKPKVLLPDPVGVAILRAPIKGLSYRRQADELRSAFTCTRLQDNIAAR